MLDIINTCFVDLDETVLSIFNRLPYEDQPKYIADIGYGNGGLLKRIYKVVNSRSARGQVLDEYPLRMIGVNYDKNTSLIATQALKDIPHLLLQGNINNPEKMTAALQERGINNPEDILYLGAWLNSEPPFILPADVSRTQNFIKNLPLWSALTGKHGLLLLNIHHLSPEAAGELFSDAHSLDASGLQTLSTPGLPEADEFLIAAAKVGLFPKPQSFRKYPEVSTFNPITLNWFEIRYTGRQALVVPDNKAWQTWLYEIDWRPQAVYGRPPTYLPTLEQIYTRLLSQLDAVSTSVGTAPGYFMFSTPNGANGLDSHSHAGRVNGRGDVFSRLDTVSADLPPYLELTAKIEALSLDYILAALTQLGWRWQRGQQFSSRQLVEQSGIVDQHCRLAERLLEILAEEEILERAGEMWEVVSIPDRQDPTQQWQRLSAQYPAAESELTLLKRCGEQLAQVLQGKQDPLQLLFPQADVTTAAALYQDSAAFGMMNNLTQQALSMALERLPRRQGVRALEIGAGTGGTTAHLLPHFPPHQTEYVFTDIGSLFIAKAREKFKDYPCVRYQVLDIEQNPQAQGVGSEQYDLVVATNVLHATRDLCQTLEHVRQLLSPGGILLLIEGTARRRWIDLIFGLLEGWWRFADHDLRPSYPLLSVEAWIDLLLTSGFDEVSTVSPDWEDDSLFPQTVIVAQKPVEVAVTAQPTQWLILADAQGTGQQLAQALDRRGQTCTLVFSGQAYQQVDDQVFRIDTANPTNYDRLLKDILAQDRPLQGIIHLWSLDIGAKMDLEQGTWQGCGTTLYLVQSLTRQFSEPPPLWLVTQGAQPVAGAPPNIAQAPLWGMGKVIALEHPELNCRRIDLDPAATCSEIEPLLEEILYSLPSAVGKEELVAFRGQARYVARLVRHRQPETDFIDQPYRLAISERGTLENLQLEPVNRRRPEPGEVEILVRATGLNFRDVLNVLDLYPGDPGEPGLECAGEITAVGEGVTGLAVGQPVLAIAPGSFGRYVTTRAALVVSKPSNLSFEEAAAIPVVFLMAYYTLHHLAKMSAGDKVLIHAAAGGVGMAAVQLAQLAGAEVFGTASPGKQSTLEGWGIKHLMNSRTLDFAGEIMAATSGQGVDIVLNSLNGEFIAKSVSVLSAQGRFVEIGKRDIWTAEQVAERKPQAAYFVVDLLETCHQEPVLIQAMLQELKRLFEAGRLKPLPQTLFPVQDVIRAFRYMQQAKHTGKIVITWPQVGPERLSLREDGTYLIIGGLSDLGLLVAGRLVDYGARHLVLVGRRDVTEAGVDGQVQALEQSGAHIAVRQADVSDIDQLGRILAEIDNVMPPLRGVIQAVGVLADGVLQQQNWDNFERVLAPKVQGSWNLHLLTKDKPLDFFVLFSSTASLIGSPGQANHAAANAFLDALAQWRQAQGLPGLSINWGLWSDIGAAERRRVAAHWQRRGIGLISPQSGLNALDYLLAQASAQVGVAPIDWPRFFKAAGLPLFYADFLPADGQESELPRTTFRRQLEQNANQHVLLQNHICEQVAGVLGLSSADSVGLRQGFFELGMDSLTSVELRNRLQRSLDFALPQTIAFDYPTVESLVDYLTQEVLKSDQVKPKPKT